MSSFIEYFQNSLEEQRWIDYDQECGKVILEDTIDFKTRYNSEWR